MSEAKNKHTTEVKEVPGIPPSMDSVMVAYLEYPTGTTKQRVACCRLEEKYRKLSITDARVREWYRETRTHYSIVKIKNSDYIMSLTIKKENVIYYRVLGDTVRNELEDGVYYAIIKTPFMLSQMSKDNRARMICMRNFAYYNCFPDYLTDCNCWNYCLNNNDVVVKMMATKEICAAPDCERKISEIPMRCYAFRCTCECTTQHHHYIPYNTCSMKCTRALHKKLAGKYVDMDGTKRMCENIHCDRCGKAEVGVKFKRCSGCDTYAYCSHKCQKTDWAIHKHICAQHRPQCTNKTPILEDV